MQKMAEMASALPLSLPKRPLGCPPPADPPRHLAGRLLTGVVRRARGDRINFLKKQTDFGSCAEEERDLTRPEGLLGGGPFPVLLTHHTRSPSERYVKQFRRLGSWERIDYVRDVKAQPPARTRLPRAFALLLLGGQQTSPYHGWRER